MKTKTGNFYECVIRYDKMMENGLMKKVSETYCVEAASFGAAEMRISEETVAFSSGEFEIKKINPAPYNEVFINDGEMFYKAKLQFVTFDETTMKEKTTTVSYLVRAADFANALDTVQKVMGGTGLDYTTAQIAESRVLEIFDDED